MAPEILTNQQTELSVIDQSEAKVITSLTSRESSRTASSRCWWRPPPWLCSSLRTSWSWARVCPCCPKAESPGSWMEASFKAYNDYAVLILMCLSVFSKEGTSSFIKAWCPFSLNSAILFIMGGSGERGDNDQAVLELLNANAGWKIAQFGDGKSC